MHDVMRFTVLASGSSGNASLLEVDGFGLLIDAGLGPRQLAWRMDAVGLSWRQVHAVLLTHTHSDHWNERTFKHLRRLGIPLYCHAAHHEGLNDFSAEFEQLSSARLVQHYEAHGEVRLSASLRLRPLELSHGEATFGFRLEGPVDLFGRPLSLAYAADLGCWSAALARDLADVDLLALEFNHDVEMEQGSGRSPELIARVLGDQGHLSNDQAAALLGEVLSLSAPDRLRHVVQLHLSRQCNRPALARAAARSVLSDLPVAVHTAAQDEPLKPITVGTGNARATRRKSIALRPAVPSLLEAVAQHWLPGMFEGAKGSAD